MPLPKSNWRDTMKTKRYFIPLPKVFFTLFLLLTLFCFLWNNYYSKSSIPHYETIDINKNVVFQLNNSFKETVNLQEFSFPLVGKNDQITLTTTLSDTKLPNAAIVLELYHSTLEVYVDNNLIYEYGHSLQEKNQVLGHGFFRISLPENYIGKELKIITAFTEDNCYTTFPNISLMNLNDSYFYTISDNILTLLVSMTLLLLGFIAIIVALTRKEEGDELKTLLYISLFAIYISIWMLCNSKLIFLIIDNFQLISVLEYYSLYLAPVLVLLYFGKLQSGRNAKRLLNGIAYLFLVTTAISVVLSVLNIYHYINILPIIHILITIGLIAILIVSIRSFRHKKKSEKILIYGMLFMGILMFLDVVRFNIYKYLDNNFHLNNSLLPIGTLIFILSMTYSYCIELIETYSGKAERQILENLAYTDVLTGIYNRTKCEAILNQIEAKENYAYIINFDLNNLKYINDNFGHHCGDSMIKAFANALQVAFRNLGTVGRMGGDEFMVILITNDENEIIRLLKRLSNFVQEINEVNQEPYELSYSFGYAAWAASEKKPIWNTYEQSDAKMYQCKKEQKQKADTLILRKEDTSL